MRSERPPDVVRKQRLAGVAFEQFGPRTIIKSGCETKSGGVVRGRLAMGAQGCGAISRQGSELENRCGVV